MTLEQRIVACEERCSTMEITFHQKSGWSVVLHHVSGIKCFGQADTFELAIDAAIAHAAVRARQLGQRDWRW